ncbi:MAG: hypothetical protein QOF26_2950 [Baekduia sp.]|nr:hypothetical protein [Baekduia sp.]
MRLLVVCHDAGGAELIAAWLATEPHPGASVCAVLGGPAVGVFARTLGPELDVRAALPSLDGIDLLVCGSSGAAELERRAVVAARAAGVPSAVWLDHWGGYRDRFVVDGTLVLPDEVWVADPEAQQLARAALPGAEIRLRGNPYLDRMVAEIRELEAGGADRPGPGAGPRVLYVTEPTSEAARRLTGDPLAWGYDERDALSAWLRAASAQPQPPAAVRVRVHPAETPEKYAATLEAGAGRRPVPIAFSAGTTLAADVAWADVVVGCDTMAMVVGLAAGRRVVSSIPPGGRPLTLPFAAIERFAPPGGRPA